jgi:hypothetical protein
MRVRAKDARYAQLLDEALERFERTRAKGQAGEGGVGSGGDSDDGDDSDEESTTSEGRRTGQGVHPSPEGGPA